MRVADYAGRAVIVTGGTRGIGRGIARAFLEAGAHVADLRPDRAVRSRPAAGADGRMAVFVGADVRDPAQAQRLIDEAVDRFGRLDVLVNNAGGSPAAAAADRVAALHAKVIELNLIAPLHVAQRANAVMQGQPEGGSIVNDRQRERHAALAGDRRLRRGQGGPASTWPPVARGRVGAEGPGERVVPGRWRPRSAVDGALPGAPAAWPRSPGRCRSAAWSRPDDVADACLFLASPLAGYISGASLLLHGGGERPA